MTFWIETIRLEMDTLDGTIPPPGEPVGEHETVIATVTDEGLRRLHALSRHYAYLAQRQELDARYLHATMARNTDAHRLNDRARILASLFWTELREQLPDYGPDEIGLRAGWQVVKLPAQPTFLAGLLGGGDA